MADALHVEGLIEVDTETLVEDSVYSIKSGFALHLEWFENLQFDDLYLTNGDHAVYYLLIDVSLEIKFDGELPLLSAVVSQMS